MIHNYINKLIDNLPDEIKNTKKPQIIDLVLDGGVFNGSYLVGALYFLKEMENKNYIKINKISGCSIGSIVGLLYFSDSLDFMENLYDIANKEFKKEYFLGTVKKLHNILKDKIPKNICEIVNNKL
jgi:predicted acylesterase/phospholipase RssA